MTRILTQGILLFACLALPSNASDSASISGQALFHSTELGSSGRSCATCHPDGKGLDKVGDFSDSELKDIINACIRDALQGTKLSDDAPALDALLRYVRNLKH